MAQTTDPEPMGEKLGTFTWPRWFQILRGIAWVLLLLAASSWLMALAVRDTEKLPDIDKITTLLFGASTISLGVFALLAGGFALFGWSYLKEHVKKEVEESMHDRISAVERELRGRSRTVLGYVIGENSVADDGHSPSDIERLREAIQHSEEAYLLLKGSGLPVEFTALNNYLSYSCVLGEKYNSDTLLKRARLLRDKAIEHNNQNLLMTYARTVLTFSSDTGSRIQACEFVKDNKDRPTLTEKQKKEANYLASLCKQ